MANATKIKSEKKMVEAYLAEHELERTVNEVLNECLRQRPEDPYAQIAGLFKEKSKAGQGVLEVHGRIVFDCSGDEAFEVEIVTDNGRFRTQVSSVRIPTAADRLVGDNFVSTINGPIAKALVGCDPADLEAADQALLALDTSERKVKIGCNTLYAASVAMCKASAIDEPVFRQIAGLMKRSEFAMPVPWFTAIERAHDAIGILPTGASSLESAIRLAREAIAALAALPEATSTESSFADLLQAVVACVSERGWAEKLKLSVTAREMILDDLPDDAAPIKDGADASENGESKEDSSEGKDAAEGENEEPGEGEGHVAPSASPPRLDVSFSPPEDARTAVLEAAKELLGNEESGLLLAVAENIFPPQNKSQMANFVEEYGEQVLLLNHVAEDGIAAHTEDGDGAETKDEDASPVEGKEASGEGSDGEADGEDAEEEGKTSSGSLDSGLPPCNGERIYIGTPFSDVFTVTDLAQVCEANASMGQAMVVVWEPTHDTYDEFAADFCVGAGIGLVQFGNFASPNTAARLNQLLRIQHALGSSAFYAGSRFRSPF